MKWVLILVFWGSGFGTTSIDVAGPDVCEAVYKAVKASTKAGAFEAYCVDRTTGITGRVK